MLGMAQRGVAEQRVDRGESGVAGAGAVVPVVLEVVQEGTDHSASRSAMSSLDGALPVRSGRSAAAAGSVAIGGDSVAGWPVAGSISRSVKNASRVARARSWSPLRCCSRRCAASASSSGAADRYQYVERHQRNAKLFLTVVLGPFSPVDGLYRIAGLHPRPGRARKDLGNA